MAAGSARKTSKGRKPRKASASKARGRQSASPRRRGGRGRPSGQEASGKSLVIVESPAKARTINRYLGPEYVVRASMGHVRDLPARKLGIDLESSFAPEYVEIPDKEEVVGELRALAKAADRVYLAPDPDREGEAIAWHLVEALEVPEDKAFRVTFNQITKAAVQSAFSHPGRIDPHKVNAQQARRVLDRIVGYKLSPLLWKKVMKGLSAGRVQSVAVRMIVEREGEIRKFRSEEYWEIDASLRAAAKGAAFLARLQKVDGKAAKLPDEASARGIVDRCGKETFRVATVTRKRAARRAAPPLITSTLQQAASTRFRMTAKRTMRVAQQLYEGLEVGSEGSVGLITYMRTDAVRVAPEAVAECRELIGRDFGEAYLPAQANVYRSRRGAQEAHEAIRPTSVMRTPESLSPHLDRDQLRIYRLIWDRFVASQMKPAELDITTADIQAGPGLFRASGQVLVFDGHLVVSQRKKGDETNGEAPANGEDAATKELPPLSEGQELELVELLPNQRFTQPPPRYTEASLVKALEKEGIGRPSTYAAILSTIQERNYVQMVERKFHASRLGEIVTEKLVGYFPEVLDIGFTARMEERLDAVEEQSADWVALLSEFYDAFKQHLARAAEEMPRLEPEPTDEDCPQCGRKMVRRLNRYGPWLACSGFPECKGRLSLDAEGNPVRPEPSGEPCPECGEELVGRQGPSGKYFACSRYPECRTTVPADSEGKPAPPRPSDEVCEKCGSAMVERMGRRGWFLACSAYPECRSTRNVPGREPEKTGETCPKCGSELVIRFSRGRAFQSCSRYPDCKGSKPFPKEAPRETSESCEECGSRMVVRTGRGGQPFLACSAYPKCRATRRMPAGGLQAS